MKTDFFIDRPVFSAVISIVIVIVGIIGLRMLPVDQYPQISPPVVKVSASYPGASAQTVTQAVATPIEQELNGTPGMLYMESSSTNSGGFSVTVTFDISTDADLAAVEVQNRIKLAESRLPAEVVQNGLSVEKQAPSRLLTICLLSSDPKFDEIYLSNFATLNVLDMLRRVPGVGRVSNIGSRYYAMQIWVQPDKLANYGLTVQDIQNALKDQNREAAAGVLGQQPATGLDITIPITTRGRLSSAEQFEEIVVRANPDGSMIRLRDIARISLEASSYTTESGINGENAAVLGINMLPGANAMEVADAVKEAMKEISKSFPEGITYEIPFDMTTYISQSIHHVYRTLFEALLLVVLVVFLSLQSWRATLIPIVAVPISLIGTFGVMLVFGFSLNMMTLLGLILAIGIVVDDAIVVVENVDRIMEEEKLNAYDATKKAMRGLGSALITMSLVLCAVFVPVSFLSGITGQLYRQFSITIAVSVLISTVVALTLSPVMCSLTLKPSDGRKKNIVFRYINRWLYKGNKLYIRGIGISLSNVRRVLAGFGIAMVAIWMMNRLVPSGFIPEEDQGYFTVELELPEGATLERTREVTERAIAYLMSNPYVEYVQNVTGNSPRVGSNQSRSELTVILKPWNDRKDTDINRIMAETEKELSRYPESKVFLSLPAAIPGLGAAGGFEMVLEARGDATYEQLCRAADTLLYYASQQRELSSISSSLQKEIPQLYFDVDRDKVKLLGIPLSDVFSTMKAFTGSVYVNDFNMFNRIYKVYIQAEASYRAHRDNLNLFFVKGTGDAMIPLTSLGTTEYTTGAGNMKRFNMFNAAVIRGTGAHGVSSGQAMELMERLVREHLPENIGVEWSGLSYQEKQEGGQTGYILALVFLFVFLFLAAQYESWSIPAAVLLSLPIACVGAYLGIWICGLENNIFFQIGLVMLMGLAAKNAILLVEFAQVEVEKGADPATAAVRAARLRFRPIVMTSFAFILGLLPLVFASGPGSASRQGIGTGVFFGMLVAITVGIVLVPFFFVLIYKLKARMKKRIRPESGSGKRFRKGGAFGKRVLRIFGRPAGTSSAAGKIGTLAVIALFSLAAASCSTSRKFAEAHTELPEQYVSGPVAHGPGEEAGTDRTALDSLTLADLEWWNFYTDTTLQALIRRALSFNRDLLTAEAAIRESAALKRIRTAGLLPELSGAVTAEREQTDYGGNDRSVDPELGIKAKLSWELDLWGNLRWARNKSIAEYLQSVEAHRALKMTLIAGVAQAYFELQALDNELAIVRQTLETRREGVHQAKLRFEGGLTSETSYRQAQVELAGTAALVPGLEGKIAAKESQIALLTGSYPYRIRRGVLSEPQVSKPLPAGVPSELLKRRPDLRRAEQQLAAANAAAGMAYTDRFPRLTLNLAYGLENDRISTLFQSPYNYVLGTLAGPLFSFGKKKAAYKASLEACEQARLQYEQKILTAFKEVSDAITEYNSIRETCRLKRNLEEAAGGSVALARLQYLNGAINYLDVLDAQRKYFDARIGLSNAVRDEYIALTRLYKALGGGWQTEDEIRPAAELKK